MPAPRPATARASPPGRARAFARCRGGAAALLFGLALLPLGAAVAVGVEYVRATSLRAKLQAGADAAVLAAVAGPVGAEVETADRLFAAHVAGLDRQASVLPLRVTVAGGGGRVVTAAFEARLPLPFGGLIGRASLDVGGRASAGASAPSYLDLTVIVDRSESMNMAADEAGRDELRRRTRPFMSTDMLDSSPTGCAFGCHVPHESTPSAPSFESVARAAGVRLRSDVVRDAVLGLVAQVEAADAAAGRLRVGLASFDATLGTMIRPTGNWRRLRDDLAAAVNQNETFPAETFAAVARDFGRSGSGASSLETRKAVLVVTDGTVGRRNSGLKSPFDPALCQPFKDAGAEVSVVHTVFVDFPGDEVWERTVRPMQAGVGPALRACASPGRYFETNRPAEIEAAFRAAFAALARPVALTR